MGDRYKIIRMPNNIIFIIIRYLFLDLLYYMPAFQILENINTFVISNDLLAVIGMLFW